jgi:hypothetical protein
MGRCREPAEQSGPQGSEAKRGPSSEEERRKWRAGRRRFDARRSANAECPRLSARHSPRMSGPPDMRKIKRMSGLPDMRNEQGRMSGSPDMHRDNARRSPRLKQQGRSRAFCRQFSTILCKPLPDLLRK